MPFKIKALPAHRAQFTDLRVREVTDYAEVAGACYTVWLRFLVAQGEKVPKRVAEIGPGDSLGVGIAALLSGADTYYPIDKFKRDMNYDNVAILEELLKLFRSHAPIPDDKAYPKAYPKLSSYAFPGDLLPNLDRYLAIDRVDKIRLVVEQIQAGNSTASLEGITISYLSDNQIPPVDYVLSTAVMEHVDDPAAVYCRTWNMIVPGGIFAHTIGLDCHETAPLWNGHWTYSDFIWRIIRGKTMYLINQWPHSWHTEFLKKLGFVIKSDLAHRLPNKLSRSDLAQRFRNIPDDDLTIWSIFVCGRKPLQ